VAKGNRERRNRASKRGVKERKKRCCLIMTWERTKKFMEGKCGELKKEKKIL
jgi:hypothetical protein